MSGLEVIGGISAIITLLDTSIKFYDNTRNDIKLPETFESVRNRLPVILRILQTCRNDLEPGKDSIPSDVCDALENILDSCSEKVRKLREIFEIVIPGEKDTWKKRYAKIIRRFGKGNKVEELMTTLTQDVQLIVNHNAVNSATPGQNAELEDILKEMKSVKTSIPDEEHTVLAFNSGGGAQTNNVNSGSGQQINNNAHVGTQNFHSDHTFRRPVGILRGEAPYIASGLFAGRKYELDEITRQLNSDHQPQRQRRLVLGGMGGIGKTQLAFAYAESGRECYSSVFWLNTLSEAALKDSFRSIASHIFDVEGPGVLEDKEIMRRVHQWLCSPKNTGWLLIFDNYDDPDQFRIDHYYPPASHGEIVVTTRRPDLIAGSIFDIMPLQNIEEGLAILQTRSKRDNILNQPYAKCLAKRLAGLPLALATVGMYLRLNRSTFSFERYFQEYEKRWNADPRRPAKLLEFEGRTLYTTWDVLYSRLEKEDPDAAKILKLLAYFDNQGIWYELFLAVINDDSPQWLREMIRDNVNFSGVMGILSDYYFLDFNRTFEQWSMHNCVHDWTLVALNKGIAEKHYWYAFDCISALIKDANKNDFAKLSYFRLASQTTRLVHQRFCQSDVIYNIN